MGKNNFFFNKFAFLYVIILFSLFINADSNNKQIFMTITSQEAYKMINENSDNSNFVILDVRTEKEFKSGHIEKAININISDKNFTKKIEKLNKNATYLVYCRSGNRSKKAANIMKEQGFKKIYDIGGIIQWQDAGYPIIK